ncbi:MAG: Ig-like domain-containing protein [Firmicutes bacterium]|nr:Ig-like domain-containing protein [Bacillota bacterium]
MKRYIIGLSLTICLLLFASIFYFGGSWGQAFAEGEEPANETTKAQEEPNQEHEGLNPGESWAQTWNVADVYGPSEGIQTVIGKATISAGAVELRNMVINGDLYLQAAIGEGEVTLTNVTITGELIVLGGGSVTIKDGQVNRLLVKNESSAVTINAEGSAAIWHVRIESECQLEEKTGDEVIGFGHVYSTTSATLTLSGNFPTLTVENESGAVNFLSGRIGKVYMESQADHSVLTLGEQTEIGVIDLASAVRIKGKGTIEQVVVLADGSEMDMDAKTYEFAAGKFVLVDGGIVDVDGKHIVTLQSIADVVLNPGKSTTKQIAVDPTDAQVTVVSSNTAAATVSLSGDTITIKSLAAGRATITVTAVKEGFTTAKETFSVTVNTPELPKVKLGGISSFTLTKGKTVQRTAEPNPSDAKVTVSSSNSGIASATISGNTISITAKAAGKTTISVRATKAGYTSGTTNFTVTVPAPPTAPLKVGVSKVEKVASQYPGSIGIRVWLSNTNSPGDYTVTISNEPARNEGSYFQCLVKSNSELAQKTESQLKSLVVIKPK